MLEEIRVCIAGGRYLIGPHAGLRQFERGITTDDLEYAVGNDEPEVIEDYPTDSRGHSCLIRGVTTNGDVVHVVCKPDDPVFIVTCYEPDPSIWYPDFRMRRTP